MCIRDRTNTTFAEPDDVEIDRIIEGQITTSQSEINIESSVKNDSMFEKQIINFLSTKNEISDDVVHLFAAVGRHDELVAALTDRFGGMTDIVGLPEDTPPDVIQEVLAIWVLQIWTL